MTTVKEVMVRRVVSVELSTPIIEVAQQMKVSETGVVAVCDNGKFWGIITEKDLVTVLATAGEPLNAFASSMMNKDWPVISPNDDILRAADVMVDNGVRVLPVVDSGKLLGLFSLDNLARESRGIAAVVFCKTTNLQASRQSRQKASVSLFG